MNRKSTHCFILVLCIVLTNTICWSQDGIISGLITIKNRVKTEGDKSERDVVVYLESVESNSYPPPVKKAFMDQKKSVFIPHVLAVQKGTTIDFLNNDSYDHNIFSPDACCKMNLGKTGKGNVLTYTFNKSCEGVILCNLHPEMAAYVIVVDSPHFIVTEINANTKSASYKISEIPHGIYVLKTWNKKLKPFKKKIAIQAGKEIVLNFDLKI